MAEPRPLTARETQAFERLPLYNVRRYDPVENPYGFDEDGYLFNQMPQADDAGIVGRFARDMAIVGYENALATEAARKGAVEAAGKTVDDVRALISADVKAAQDARTGAEAAAGETADDLRAIFTEEVQAARDARVGAEEAVEAAANTLFEVDERAKDADASARAAAAAALSVDGPAIAASIADAKRNAYALNLHYGS